MALFITSQASLANSENWEHNQVYWLSFTETTEPLLCKTILCFSVCPNTCSSSVGTVYEVWYQQEVTHFRIEVSRTYCRCTTQTVSLILPRGNLYSLLPKIIRYLHDSSKIASYGSYMISQSRSRYLKLSRVIVIYVEHQYMKNSHNGWRVMPRPPQLWYCLNWCCPLLEARFFFRRINQ